MVIPSVDTLQIFGVGYYNSNGGLYYQRNVYRIRRLNIKILFCEGIKTYAQFSRLFHEYIAFVDPIDIYNYWEGITFKEVMNDYVSHILLAMKLRNVEL